MDVTTQIESLGVVPVVKIEDAKDALQLGKALVDGGLPIAEVTFRTDAAEEAIRILAENFPKMLVGAGTVLNVDNVEKAVNSGAQFIVAPGFNPEVVDYCLSKNIPVYPGVNNPTQIEMGLSRGLKILKFFPSEASGGLKTLKAVSAAYGDLRFMPTGGISKDNIGEYLRFDKIIACGGSWMVRGDLISSGKFDEIARLAHEAVLTAIGFEFAHVGINSSDEKTAGSFVDTFRELYGLDGKEGNSSFFIGKEIEVVKSPFLGSHGHLAIKVNRMSLAKAYLERQGIPFDESTAKYKGDKLVAIYLKEEMNGMAIHLLQA